MNQIGFHEGKPNEYLVQHGDIFGPKRRVLVPLCGKTKDLDWLAERGHEVVGIELADVAVHAFFDERGIAPTIDFVGPFTRYRHGPVDLLVGDFFEATKEAVGPVDAFYDRAALIALPPEMRARYAPHLLSLLPPAFVALLIALEFVPEDKLGPPHAVSATEIGKLFSRGKIDKIGDRDALEDRFRAEGIAHMRETCWSIVAG